jgi:protoporphyrinogen oxidase
MHTSVPHPSIVIVGGGVLGLSLAARLAARGATVRVIESAPTIGGLASSHTVGDLSWDRFYHVILESDHRTRAFVGSAGLGDIIQWGTTRTGFYVDDRFHSMSNSLEFLRFPPLSLVSKARLAWTIIHTSRIDDISSLEDELVEPWLRRHSGAATFTRLWRPLLRAKLGERYRVTSAAFIGATIARMYAARRAGLKEERLGWLPGGWGPVLDQLQNSLRAQRVAVDCGVAVTAVSGASAGVTITLDNGTTLHSDAVVLTTSCRHIERLVPQLSDAERDRLHRVQYLGVICVSVLLDRALGPYYVTNITDDGIPFTAVIEMSALASHDALGGQGLVYLPQYVSAEDPLWHDADDAIIERFLAGLERMYPGARATVRAVRVARARDVMAIPTVGYSKQALPPVQTTVPGVFVANSAQIAAGTLNVNETLAVGDGAMRELELAGVL